MNNFEPSRVYVTPLDRVKVQNYDYPFEGQGNKVYIDLVGCVRHA